MKTIIINILWVVTGLIIGSTVNMAIVMIGPILIPPPEGADMTSMDGIKASIDLFEPKHFIFPFLAHALGTLVGAFLVAKLVTKHELAFAMAVGVLFLAGGISNIMMLGGPMWFNALDLSIAYLPMAYLGWRLGH